MNSPAVPSAEVWLVLLHLTPFILCTQCFTEVILCAGMHVCLLNRVYIGTPRVVWLNPRGFTSVIYGKKQGLSDKTSLGSRVNQTLNLFTINNILISPYVFLVLTWSLQIFADRIQRPVNSVIMTCWTKFDLHVTK